MLVCNVSLRPRRTVAAGIVEAAAATETTSSLVGELMVEVASAVDTITVLGSYTSLVAEPASASDTISATAGAGDAAMLEAATAADTQDATVIGGAASRSAMLPDMFVNSDGTAREANANGVMVNL